MVTTAGVTGALNGAGIPPQIRSIVMIGNMYTWAFAEERIQAVNEAHRAEAAALNRVAQAADSTGQAPHRGRTAPPDPGRAPRPARSTEAALPGVICAPAQGVAIPPRSYACRWRTLANTRARLSPCGGAGIGLAPDAPPAPECYTDTNGEQGPLSRRGRRAAKGDPSCRTCIALKKSPWTPCASAWPSPARSSVQQRYAQQPAAAKPVRRVARLLVICTSAHRPEPARQVTTHL